MGVINWLKSLLRKKTREQETFESIKKMFTRNGELIFAGELLRIAYERYSDHIVLITQEQQLSYKELYLQSLIFSKELIALGVKSKDRVVIYAENSIRIDQRRHINHHSFIGY